MADILLPPNATLLERGLEQAMAVYGDVRDPGIADLWRPETCPPALLPWLAWALSIRQWDAAWPVAVQRAAVAAAYAMHRRTGTRSAVEGALEEAGAEYRIVEQGKAARPASVTIGAGNASFVLTARTAGQAGNGISIELGSRQAGGPEDLSVFIVGDAVQVFGRRTAQPTAAEVVAALRGSAAAAALIVAVLAPGSDGSGTIDAAPRTLLSGGADADGVGSGFRMRIEIANSAALLGSGALAGLRDRVTRVKRVSVHETIVATAAGLPPARLALVGAVGAVVVPPVLALRAGGAV